MSGEFADAEVDRIVQSHAELLGALKGILAYFGPGNDIHDVAEFRAARAAIAKAEGTS